MGPPQRPVGTTEPSSEGSVAAVQTATIMFALPFTDVMLLAIATATGEWSRLSFTTRTAGAMIYLVLFGTILGYSSYVYALKYLPVSTVALYAYVNPIIAVILGTLILSEPFSSRIVVAAAMARVVPRLAR